MFLVVASTMSSITVQWRPGQSLGNSIQGYFVNFKREFGEWEKIKLLADKTNYTLEGLQCGTKYQFFLRAFNQLGMSNPTDIITSRTQGSAPVIPLPRELIHVNSTSISLDLGSWKDGGCPITSLVVEYKQKQESQWTLVSNNIKFEQVDFLVLDLSPETWYTLRMTAHNSAGSSVVHLDFVTLTASGVAATVPPGLIVNSSYGDGRFYKQPGVLVSLVAAALIIVIASAAICYYKKRKEAFAGNNYGGGEGSAAEPVEADQYIQHAQHCEKLHHLPGSQDSMPVDLQAPYGSCNNSIYAKTEKKPEYQNEGMDWIPLHSLYQAHRY